MRQLEKMGYASCNYHPTYKKTSKNKGEEMMKALNSFINRENVGILKPYLRLQKNKKKIVARSLFMYLINIFLKD